MSVITAGFHHINGITAGVNPNPDMLFTNHQGLVNKHKQKLQEHVNNLNRI